MEKQALQSLDRHVASGQIDREAASVVAAGICFFL